MKFLLLFFAVLLAGCAGRPRAAAPAPEPPPVSGPAFVELQAGWRLRVVTPLLRSGGFRLRAPVAAESGKTVTVDTAGEFLGYETAYYDVRAAGQGTRVQFGSATRTAEGVASPAPRPTVLRFRTPRRTRHHRVLFLQRVSDADHNTALLAAVTPDAIVRLTNRVLAAASACDTVARGEHCEWVPEGVAVRPERFVNGAWVPAR